MNPCEYQKLAAVTQCPQPGISVPGHPTSSICNAAILHGALGIASEGGELLAECQRWIWYKKDLNRNNVKEELGDVLWYVAEVCNALGFTMDEIMYSNIAKLKQRYPEKYTDYHAAEENRDRHAEEKVIRSVADVMRARQTLAGCCKNFPGVPCDCLDTAQLLEGSYKEKHAHA